MVSLCGILILAAFADTGTPAWNTARRLADEIVPFAGYGAFDDADFKPDAEKAVFVAPDGDDANGTGTAARPFASVERALAEVRGRDSRTILVRGGRYVLSKGIRICAGDSGTAESPLVIAAAPGETPVLDGGREIGGFAPCGRGEILSADLKGLGLSGMERPLCWGYAMSGKGERHILDLYEDDVPGDLARHPNEGFFATTWADKTNRLFKIDMPDAAAWANEPEMMALTYMRWLWGDETTRLKVDAADGAMQIDTNLVNVVKVGRPVRLVNSLKALDAPGEWFLDHADLRLYHWPRRRGSRVVLSQLAEPILGIEGARYVEVRGLTVQNGRAAGIRANKCAHLRIVGNTVRNLGSGISVRGEDIVVCRNRLRSFSHGGISAYGGDRRTLTPSGIRILRNEVSDIERKVRTYCPCVQAEGVGMEIAFNHFHDCPSSAIRLEGNDMLINSNLVENCVLESDDQGAVDIYANPTYAGIEIVGNTWRDIGRGGRFVPCGQAAIRFDDVISGVKVRLNRFYNCGYAHFGAVQINGGRLNVVESNFFVDCRRDCSINIRKPEWWRRTMTEGYCKPKIEAVKPAEGVWRKRYPYLSRLLDWPCVNFVSRNVYANTPKALGAAARPAPRAALAERIACGPELVGIVHWGLNTFTDREWGYGDEDPALLDPAKFDADQIVGACKAGGIGGLIVVAKHHDGFCLWPTRTTEHNISKAPFRGGRGDYVKEMERACRRHGVKFGVYVSPWDRNSAHYATEKYVEIYHAQIRELLGGGYGEVFEMWFDGANGGDGWYGGAKEKRRIGAGYYRFDEVFRFVRALQPHVTIFAGESDDSDFRWPGNERGVLDPGSRATVCTVGDFADGKYGNPDYKTQINTGSPEGEFFRMCETDFPLRKGWFHHERERGTTKRAAYLAQRYVGTVGNGGTMNIGLAPNRDGVLDEDDVRELKGFKAILDALFAHEVKDGDPFNVVELREDLANGEQVDGWRLLADGREILSGTAVGSRRIRLLAEPVTAKDVRLEITAHGGNPLPVAVRCFHAAPQLVEAVVNAVGDCGETDTVKGLASTAR